MQTPPFVRSPRWKRLDQWFIEGVLGFVAVASGLVAIGLVVDAARTNLLRPDISLAKAAVPVMSQHAGRFSLRAHETAQLIISTPTVGERIAYALPGVLAALLGCIVAWQLMRVFATLRTGDPFGCANTRRITVIGLIFVIGGGLWAMSGAAASFWLAGHAYDAFDAHATSPVMLATTFNYAPVFIGGVLGSFAEFFRRGAELRREVEGLV